MLILRKNIKKEGIDMLKGKLKYIILSVGVFIVTLSIMRNASFAFNNFNGSERFAESRTYKERFMSGPRGHHRMMWNDEEEFRGHHRGCMPYFQEDYDYEGEVNK